MGGSLTHSYVRSVKTQGRLELDNRDITKKTLQEGNTRQACDNITSWTENTSKGSIPQLGRTKRKIHSVLSSLGCERVEGKR